MWLQQTYLDSTLPSPLRDARDLAAAPVDPGLLSLGPAFFPNVFLDAIVVTGRDRLRFLHAMLSNEVQKLLPGQGVWATLNNVQGRTVTDVRILADDPDPKSGRTLALCESGGGARFVETLERFVVSEKVRFERRDTDALMWICGKGAEAAVRDRGGPIPAEPPFSHAVGSIADRPVRTVRFDRSGYGDLLLWCAAEDREVIEAVFADLPQPPATTLEAARVAAGLPRYGIDWTEINVPLEAGLKDRAISFVKGCYIGQEVICRLDAMGTPARRLMRLAVNGEAEPGDLLLVDGKEVGWLTTVWRPPEGDAQALGYVKKAWLASGTQLQSRDGASRVEVVGAVT